MNNTDVLWKPLPVTKMQDNLYWMGHSPRPTGEFRVLSRPISSWEDLTALYPQILTILLASMLSIAYSVV